MKKLIILAIVFLAYFNIQAQNVSGYWTETTKGQSTKWGQSGYAVGTTVARGETDSTTAIYSRPFGQSAAGGEVRNAFMGKKVLVGINITVAFADVNATVVSQISHDGVTWVDYATLDSDSTPNVTGVQLYLADFTSTDAPYTRIAFNGGGLKIGNTGRVQFIYCVPAN